MKTEGFRDWLCVWGGGGGGGDCDCGGALAQAQSIVP